jgi:predicted ATPase
MYIQKAEITNIKSIEKFKIEFKNPAGWHVLIGDNGSGKTTIVRAIALALVGGEAEGLRANWLDWLNRNTVNDENGKVSLDLFRDKKNDDIEIDGYQKFAKDSQIEKDEIYTQVILTKERERLYIETPDGYLEVNNNPTSQREVYFYSRQSTQDIKEKDGFWAVIRTAGFFSVAFGPYRRFSGGGLEWEKVYNDKNLENLAGHLSVFDESVALTEPIKWIIRLFNESNDPTLTDKEKQKRLRQLENLKKLINSEDFLPNNTKLEIINSKEVQFKDGNSIIDVNQLSDGYRSILSLTFELIRQLVRVYGSDKVFKSIEKGEMFIDLPGVVLIDEIDAHLHPTWQTRIGQWFLKYFPQLQFIVTTHSPLVCRACEKGSIWKLAPPGNKEGAKEITGIDRDRLIFGNILEAIGTGVFGEVSISQESSVLLNRLAELNIKSMMGLIENNEIEELQTLRTKFPIESNINITK